VLLVQHGRAGSHRLQITPVNVDRGKEDRQLMTSSRSIQRHTPLGLRLAAPVVLLVVLLALWQLVVSSGSVPASLLPAPGKVWHRLVLDLGRGPLLGATLTTIWEAVLGCLVATCVALPIGYLIARVRVAEAALSPFLAASQAIPAVALAPLLVIWVGYGLTPIVLLCALLVFFPLLLATVLGLRSIDTDIVEAAELDGASGWRMVRYIEAPLSRAALLTGIRNGFTLSVTGAVVGEFVMGGTGLGQIVSVESQSADTTGLFATLIMLCALATAIYLGLLGLERLTDPQGLVRSDRGIGNDDEGPELHRVTAEPVAITSTHKELVA